jgi:hypothetical protein
MSSPTGAAAAAIPALPPDRQSLPAAQLFLPLLTQSLHGFTVCDAAGCYIYASESIQNLFGFSPHALQGCAAAHICGAAHVCAAPHMFAMHF